MTCGDYMSAQGQASRTLGILDDFHLEGLTRLAAAIFWRAESSCVALVPVATRRQRSPWT